MDVCSLASQNQMAKPSQLTSLSRKPFSSLKPTVSRRSRLQVSAKTQQEAPATSIAAVSRRSLLSSTAVLGASLALPQQSLALPSGKAQTPQVGTYLPPAGVENFVEFVPDAQKTPALRAGTVNPNEPYRFAMPPTWREGKVANIQSGNYCQPKCAEPWTEVVFSDPTEGKAVVIVAPLVRLTNKAEAKLEEIGTPEGIVESIGAFITGTYLDSEDVVTMDTFQKDGRTYYKYETNAPYGSSGAHALTAVTTKGNIALLFVVTADNKQWAASEGKLRTMLETFRA